MLMGKQEKLFDSALLSKSFSGFGKTDDARDFDSFEQWQAWVEEEDARTGQFDWREKESSRHYDYRAVRRRYRKLKDLREEGNDRGLLFALHEGVHGNMGRMGNPNLYVRSKIGTKHLIEDYIDEICLSLRHIDNVPDDVISDDEKWAFFDRVDNCFGRSALMLSGGAVLGYFHYGVVRAMFERNVLPNVISGSSAGSITAAVLGTHTDRELKKVFSPERLLLDAEYEANFLQRLLKPQGDHMDSKEIADNIAHLVPDLTFEEAFNKTGRHINITVAPASRHQTSRLLNNITSPNVYIRSAVQASCAVPGIYESVQLRAKNFKGGSEDYLPSRRWVDGSMDDDLPAKRLSRLYGVNHYIASQANPIVLPFVSHPESNNFIDLVSRPYKAFAKESVKSWRSLANRLNVPVPRRMRLLADFFYQISMQKYTADITIMLNPRQVASLRLLSRPTAREVETLIRAGERATWPQINRIDLSMRVSRTVQEILSEYKLTDAA